MMENYWPAAGDKPTATKHDIEHAKWYSKVHKVVLPTFGVASTHVATHAAYF